MIRIVHIHPAPAAPARLRALIFPLIYSLLLLVLFTLSACSSPPSLAEKVNGTWQTEGASITLDTNAGTYSALIASQQVDRKLKVVSATERTVRMLLDGERELVATFPSDSWDKVTLEQPNSWSYEFTRVE